MKLNTDVRVKFNKKIKFVKLIVTESAMSQTHKLYYIDISMMRLS